MVEQDWARPVVQWEIQAVDPEKMNTFYATLFNWTIGGGKKVKRIDPGIGAPEPRIAGTLRPSDTSRISLYIPVLHIRESMEKAVTLGGTILREPFDSPGGQTLAWIADPEGNQLTLVQQ